ncbi:FtsJ-domain-containing protein [Aulographum hederae CBS 113979]|uniref:Putative tRNA (cytidine(32)/guanosine(34)-2'-O)-methyltransferase n=1 Tax=Aulographum hederae CBS 113979 TaxID=1176131 RepID=A0A6G1GVK3_9PEZI|nr:FtsJ-domain-containing protein [Aulographum hederae CBS 113979]
MGKSSKDKRDAYYRLAKEQGWRARSAFKLLQLDEEFNLFENVTRVVDLCAAPGSWSQVLSRILIKGEKFGREAWEDKQARDRIAILGSLSGDQKTSLEIESAEANTPTAKDILQVPDSKETLRPRQNVKIVAIDLQPMSPLEGITTLKADITHPSTVPLLLQALDPDSYDPSATSAAHPVDLVISDGAPDVTGLHDLDIYVQSQLLWAALNLALCVLKPGGKFVAKIFRGKDVDLLYVQMRLMFENVTIAKPRSSRASSIEAFIVCENFRPPRGFRASLDRPLGVGDSIEADEEVKRERTKPSKGVNEDGIVEDELGSDSEEEESNRRWIAPFLACGDLSAFDADASYHLPEDRKVLDPVQPPTAPPYKRALEMRKAAGGAYGKTKCIS